jgi:hypothetical protein
VRVDPIVVYADTLSEIARRHEAGELPGRIYLARLLADAGMPVPAIIDLIRGLPPPEPWELALDRMDGATCRALRTALGEPDPLNHKHWRTAGEMLGDGLSPAAVVAFLGGSLR